MSRPTMNDKSEEKLRVLERSLSCKLCGTLKNGVCENDKKIYCVPCGRKMEGSEVNTFCNEVARRAKRLQKCMKTSGSRSLKVKKQDIPDMLKETFALLVPQIRETVVEALREVVGFNHQKPAIDPIKVTPTIPEVLPNAFATKGMWPKHATIDFRVFFRNCLIILYPPFSKYPDDHRTKALLERTGAQVQILNEYSEVLGSPQYRLLAVDKKEKIKQEDLDLIQHHQAPMVPLSYILALIWSGDLHPITGALLVPIPLENLNLPRRMIEGSIFTEGLGPEEETVEI